MKKIFVNSMFVVAAVAMVSCGSKQTANQSVEASVVLPKIEAEAVSSRVVSQEMTFTGTVEAQVVNNIAPQQPLRIKEIRFDVGDHVRKGDLLVRLDNSSLVQAKAQLENAQKEYERTNELYEFGGASKSEWDARRLQYEVAQTAYKNLVENTTLISPISGIVTSRNYDNGDMYAGQPVLVIEQIRPVKIMINVSEPLFAKVKRGMLVYITLDAYGDEVFKGKIARVYPTINQATHTFQVEVSIPNSNERVRRVIAMFLFTIRQIALYDTLRLILVVVLTMSSRFTRALRVAKSWLQRATWASPMVQRWNSLNKYKPYLQ